jgi:hypothetical protein
MLWNNEGRRTNCTGFFLRCAPQKPVSSADPCCQHNCYRSKQLKNAYELEISKYISNRLVSLAGFDNGKVSVFGTTSNSGLNLEHIINSAEGPIGHNMLM